MNKRNTKLTKIASLAAMLLPLAFSGSAVAGKNDNNGQKGSITVASLCKINADKSLTVQTIIMDASSVPGDAILDSMEVTAVDKTSGKNADTSPLASEKVQYPTFTSSPFFADCKANGDCNEVTIKLCPPEPRIAARSLNAVTEVFIKGEHNNKETQVRYDEYGNPYVVSLFESNCTDDPETEEDEVALLNIGNQSKLGAFCSR